MSFHYLLRFLLPFLVISLKGQSQRIAFFNQSVVSQEIAEVKAYIVNFGDTTETGRLYQHLTDEGVPVSYSRPIRTSVCFDGKCRLLDVVLYWTATGSYHGFELPPGEFLSKTDHDPFSEQEYLKLHQILADSLSPLGDYTFDELVPGTGNPDEVDAVSSATLKDILDYIVPGAAYTTYRLWHLVYGETATWAARYTEKMFSSSLAEMLLTSENPAEQIWVLYRVPTLEDWGNRLTRRVLDLVGHRQLNVSMAALNALSGGVLKREDVQQTLLRQVVNGDYSLKKTAILKLKEADYLHPAVGVELLNVAPQLNGDLLGEVLALFLKHQLIDVDVQRKIAEILLDENRYKAGKALRFLEQLRLEDEEVKKRIREFHQKTNG